MLEFAKAQKETIAIVADAVDRFQRSFKESVLIDELIHGRSRWSCISIGRAWSSGRARPRQTSCVGTSR